MASRPKFEFYEKVRIISPSTQTAEVFGEIAAVLGRAANEEGKYFYTVFVYRDQICWQFREEELEGTGEFDTRESFYSGESVRVNVDEKARGQLISE